MPKISDVYAIAAGGAHWTSPQDFEAVFNWDYDEGRAAMMGLYRKGVEMQWDAATRIDWSQALDEDNPQELPEEMLSISGMPEYERMSKKEKALVRRHAQAWQISQFMQGEQGALICAAKIYLFQRIVPIVKDIGLWGPLIRKGYEDMGIIGFAEIDVQALQETDERIARDFDSRRVYVDGVVARAAGADAA